MSRGRKFVFVLLILLFLVGIGLLLYPQINQYFTFLNQRIDVRSFLLASASDDTETEATDATVEADPLLEAARKYNESLVVNGQDFSNSAVFTVAPLNLADYGYEDDIFAVLSIPAIDLEMPIYLGASYDNLTKGACVIGQTSLPIGGESTNSVIAGHRGWQGATMFKKIPNLQIGDTVTITNMWETLTYKVIEKQTISSSDCAAVSIREGRDLVTLFTCDYAANGIKLRALVICERVTEES